MHNNSENINNNLESWMQVTPEIAETQGWVEMQKLLKEKRKRRVFFWWFFGAVALLVAYFGLMLYYKENINASSQPVTTKSVTEKNKSGVKETVRLENETTIIAKQKDTIIANGDVVVDAGKTSKNSNDAAATKPNVDKKLLANTKHSKANIIENAVTKNVDVIPKSKLHSADKKEVKNTTKTFIPDMILPIKQQNKEARKRVADMLQGNSGNGLGVIKRKAVDKKDKSKSETKSAITTYSNSLAANAETENSKIEKVKKGEAVIEKKQIATANIFKDSILKIPNVLSDDSSQIFATNKQEKTIAKQNVTEKKVFNNNNKFLFNTGLDWNTPLPITKSEYYLTNTNFKPNILNFFIPSIWVSSNLNNKHTLLLGYTPFAQYNAPIAKYASQTGEWSKVNPSIKIDPQDPLWTKMDSSGVTVIDSTVEVTKNNYIAKAFGYSFYLDYYFSLSKNWQIGAGVNYNFITTILSTSNTYRNIDNLLAGTDSVALKPQDYAANGFNNTFLSTKIALVYNYKHISFGVNYTMPISTINKEGELKKQAAINFLIRLKLK